MLVDRYAYGNRWRAASPEAKATFAAGGFIAAFGAGRPSAALTVAVAIALVTIGGARVPLTVWLRVAVAPLGFLLVGMLSLVFSVDAVGHGALSLRWLPDGWEPVLRLGTRSIAALSALLFLALTTPLLDIVALLRRLRVPATLLDLMVLCYRTLFVLTDAAQAMRTAQAARLGYATARGTFNSLGLLLANLTVQVWERSRAMQRAAQSRNGDGAWRFLEHDGAMPLRELALALSGAVLLVAYAFGNP